LNPARENQRVSLRVVAALRPGDQSLIEALVVNGCVVVSAPPESLDRVAGIERAGAVVADADLPGAIESVTRMRRSGGSVSSVPVILVGGTQHNHSAHADGTHPSGADLVLVRPVVPNELAQKLRDLFDREVLFSVSASRTSAPGGRTSQVPAMPNRVNKTPIPVLARNERSPLLRAPTAPPRPATPTNTPSPPGGVTTVARTSSPSLPPFSNAVHASIPPPVDGPLAHAASPALRPGVASAAALAPPSLAGPLASLLRSALVEVGGNAESFELPALTNDDLDDLVPPELLEPLDAPLDTLSEETPEPTRSPGTTTSPGISTRKGPSPRAPGTNANVTPLPLDGDLRLGGTLGRFGVAQLFSAAHRVKATGQLALHTGGTSWWISIHAGHLLALRGARPEDHIGAILARLGYLPREAARFAEVPLDTGVRGAALLAARGYIASDGLAAVLARAAQEITFDLLCLDSMEWELHPLEDSVGIPLQTRALDALLLHGARARIEPATAFNALGGDGTILTVRSDAAALGALPLSEAERAAALSARTTPLTAMMRTHGETVLPSLLVLHWLQHLRAEGPAHELASGHGPPPHERVRLRALTEAARRKDHLAILGISPWATRNAALSALEARRGEIETIRGRYPTTALLPAVLNALDEISQFLNDPPAWERYLGALRVSSLREDR